MLHDKLSQINMLFAGLVVLFSISVHAQKKGEKCTVERTDTEGVCTKVSDCPSVRSEYFNSGVEPTYCDQSYKMILVCCNDGRNMVKTASYDRPPVWGTSAAVSRGNQRLSDRKCAEYSLRVTEVVEYIPLESNPEKREYTAPKCEYEKVKLIVGGQNAEQGEFPHMAAIGWLDESDNYLFHCGGSLISTRYVVTAGHCIRSSNKRYKNPVPEIVRLGDQNLKPSVKDQANPIDISIKSIRKHPLYHSPIKYHDIALFELERDVVFRVDIRPACLWSKPSFSGYTQAVATGWGVVNPSRSSMTSDILQKVSLTLFDNDLCTRTLKIRHWNGSSDEQLCAGELRVGKDTCQGDSGSPLQVSSFTNKCIFHVIGVTSFGKACASAGKPAVYTRVSSYLDWIESVVWPGE